MYLRLSLLSFALFVLQLSFKGGPWFCRASPVSDRNPKQAILKGKDHLQIEKDWLTLGTPGSSSYSMTPAANVAPSTLPQPYPARAQSPPRKTSRWRPLNKDESAKKERHDAQALGAERLRQRREWNKVYPDRLPPVILMSQFETKQIGLHHQGSRYEAVRYLEEMKMRKEGINWPRQDYKMPKVMEKLRPLKKIPFPSGRFDSPNHFLIKKQEEVNRLLHDEGLLVTSDGRKRAASELVGKIKRNRPSKVPSSQAADLPAEDRP